MTSDSKKFEVSGFRFARSKVGSGAGVASTGSDHGRPRETEPFDRLRKSLHFFATASYEQLAALYVLLYTNTGPVVKRLGRKRHWSWRVVASVVFVLGHGPDGPDRARRISVPTWATVCCLYVVMVLVSIYGERRARGAEWPGNADRTTIGVDCG
jgi:hypothetical protein